jgi:hypothetical protein
LLIGRLANDGKEKAALAALVFEDWNGPTSSQRAAPKRLKHIEVGETPKPKHGRKLPELLRKL